MYPSKTKAAGIARDTLDALAAGRYTNRAGETVSFGDQLAAAKRGTVTYSPDDPLPRAEPASRETVFAVVNDTTLEACRALVSEGFNPVALNFASARHPGGGLLNGNAMYRHHATVPGGWYTYRQPQRNSV